MAAYTDRTHLSAMANGKQRKVVLVTGASSGIGRAAAARFREAGHVVFGTSRKAQAGAPGEPELLALDVEDAASVAACVGAVLDRAGRIDVLVSNAGRMVFGPAEEVPLEEAQRMFECNLWGAARLVNAVLPAMRAQGGGHVVVVGSIAAGVAIPLNAFYAASKAALARYTEALRLEVRHLGVRVALVEPGDVRTRFWDDARVVPPVVPAYAELRRRVLDALGPALAGALDPAEVAAAVVEAAVAEAPAPVYRVGAMTRRMPWMRALMPATVFEGGLRRRFGLDRV
jgi:NAD(P)-dependent dehydrogenase (short-subunit alcohol dehydrogenase family)